ncbi:MAG: hypothetical protein Q4E57_04840 [Eubacteriales bacterium]|nr:hypothetical protein [Eubacteriales bacterium]
MMKFRKLKKLKRLAAGALSAILTISAPLEAMPAAGLNSIADRIAVENADIANAVFAEVATATDMRDGGYAAEAADILYGEDGFINVGTPTDMPVATPTDMEPEYVDYRESSEEIDTQVVVSPAISLTGVAPFSQSVTIDGVIISIEAPEKVFPNGAQLSVKKVVNEETKSRISDAIDEAKAEEDAEDAGADAEAAETAAASGNDAAASYAYDIKVMLSGEEVEPDTSYGEVQVSFALENIPEGTGLKADVYHVKENKEDSSLTAKRLESTQETGIIDSNEAADSAEASGTAEAAGAIEAADATEAADAAEGLIITAVTDSFSYYVVEFTFSGFEYVLEGSESVYLSEILSALNISGTPEAVTVSDPELIGVTTTAGASTGDTAADAATAESLAAANADGAYIITALKPFNTEEWMKVTIGGLVYTIMLTDDNCGAFTVTGGKLGVDYGYRVTGKYNGKDVGVLTINPQNEETITIANIDPETPTLDRIEIAAGNNNINIVLNNVNISTANNLELGQPSPGPAILINKDTNITITLADGSANKLVSNSTGYAAISKNGDTSETSGTLTIKGGTAGTGALTAITAGGQARNQTGSGIGSDNGSCCNIIIEGGIITARGSKLGAGIGSGGSANSSGKATCSNIQIKGGTVTAYDYGNTDSKGAAIGGGFYSSVKDIIISGGTVTATAAGSAAAIGSGNGANADGITISGGTVKATGGDDANNSGAGAGIGAGQGGNASNITISGGTVSAKGGTDAPGIGAGAGGVLDKLTVSGGIIRAEGGSNGAGIGSGISFHYNTTTGEIYSIEACKNVKITGGTVTAVAGSCPSASTKPDSIGVGANGNGFKRDTASGTVIDGGSVKAESVAGDPVNSKGYKVYLFTQENANNDKVSFDGTEYTSVAAGRYNHALESAGDTNLYAFRPTMRLQISVQQTIL